MLLDVKQKYHRRRVEVSFLTHIRRNSKKWMCNKLWRAKGTSVSIYVRRFITEFHVYSKIYEEISSYSNKAHRNVINIPSNYMQLFPMPLACTLIAEECKKLFKFQCRCCC